MPELEDVTESGVPRHFQEYFAPPDPEVARTLTVVSPAGDSSSTSVVSTSDKDESEEIAALMRLIAEKDHAIINAALTAQDLQQKLDEEKAESLNLRSELQTISHAPPEETALLPEPPTKLSKPGPDFVRIQKSLDLERLQSRGQRYHLEQESRARRIASAQAAAKMAALQRDLAARNERLAAANEAGKSSSSTKRILAVASVCAALIAGAGLLRHQFPARAAAASGPSPPRVNAVVDAGRGRFARQATATPVSHPGFQGSLSRLNQALVSLGNRPPQDVMREVRLKTGDASLCAFQWKNGQPALTFGAEGVKTTLSESLQRCATAVENLR